MQHRTGITIANELDLKSMQRASDVPYISVLDLRFTDQGSARAVEEEVLLRLRNLHVGYEQLPVDMARPHGWQKNALMRHIAENLNQVMVITDQPELVSEFCRSIDVSEVPTDRVDDMDADNTGPQLQVSQSSQPGFHQSVVI